MYVYIYLYVLGKCPGPFFPDRSRQERRAVRAAVPGNCLIWASWCVVFLNFKKTHVNKYTFLYIYIYIWGLLGLRVYRLGFRVSVRR